MEFKNNAKWIEVFCAYAINNYVIKDSTLIVGDLRNENLPDIYNSSHSLGIEVVQLEKDCDLDTKYIWKEYKEKDGDFESLKKFCDTKYPGKYELTERDGKLVAFSPNEGFHRIDWMREIYTRNITKKLQKLNNGNYSGINGPISLCMSIIHRAKSLYDVLLILSIYSEHSRQFKITYDNLIIVTSKQIYLTTSEKVENFPHMESQEQISDFVNNHLTIIDYNYNECHELTSTHFPNI